MQFNGIYVDDDSSVRNLLPRLESENIKIKLLEPSDLVKLADQIIRDRPDFVLLDYRLDEFAGSREEAAAYRAAPLAQQIRDRLGCEQNLDFPIVLISSEHKIKTLFRPEKTAHDLFDWKLIKNSVAEKNSRDSEILLGLVNGYHALRNQKNNFANVDIFGVTKDHHYLIDHQELIEALKDAEYPHIAARYILNFLIRRQGPLLDSFALFARLGIVKPKNAESIDALYRWLNHCAYKGVFSECGERWWSALIEEELDTTLSGPVDRFTAIQRAEKISEKINYKLEPAIDSWAKSSAFHPVFACVTCQSATPLKHSLSCLDARLPNFVQRHRVCFSCLQKDKLEEFNQYPSNEGKLVLDEAGHRIAEQIRSGKITYTAK